MLRFSVASHWITAILVFPSERQCSVFGAIWASRIPLSQQVNGNAPFFRAFFGVFSDIERQCSVFQAVFKSIFGSKVGGLNRPEWVGMLRFRHLSLSGFMHFQKDMPLISSMVDDAVLKAFLVFIAYSNVVKYYKAADFKTDVFIDKIFELLHFKEK